METNVEHYKMELNKLFDVKVGSDAPKSPSGSSTDSHLGQGGARDRRYELMPN